MPGLHMSVRCKENFDGKTFTPMFDETKPKAINAWNTRADSSSKFGTAQISVDEIAEVIDQVYDCDHNGVNYISNWEVVAEAIHNRIYKEM